MNVTTRSVAGNAHFWAILGEKYPQNAQSGMLLDGQPRVCCAFSSIFHPTLPQNWTFWSYLERGGE